MLSTLRVPGARFGILLVGVVLLLTSCNGLLLNEFFASERAREAYIYDDFAFGFGESWRTGAEEGYAVVFNFFQDYFAALGERQVVAAVDSIPSDVEIRVQFARWQLFSGPGTRDNGDSFDVRIVLHDSQIPEDPDPSDGVGAYTPSGPVIGIKLDEPGLPDVDRLWIAESPAVGADRSEAPFRFSPGLDARDGLLVVTVLGSSTPPRISARMEDTQGDVLLEVEREMDGTIASELYLAVQVSGDGSGTEPRVIDSVMALEAR